MDPPPLKLIMLQGPRQGETLEFRAGSTIRIGRLVRGNNLPIKDVGISSKHLTIESEPESGKWTVTDLDSSNGTTLNSTKLPSHTTSDLRDGDSIKLGEYTSILIKINGHDESKLRRNPRRQEKAKDTKVEVEEKEKSEELEDNSPEIKEKRGRGRGRGRGRPPKGEKVETRENVRVTRSRKNEGFVVPVKAEVLVVPDSEERKVPEEPEVECGGRKNNEGKKTRGAGGRRRKNLKEEDNENVENLNLQREGGDKENVEVLREEGGEEAASGCEVENGGDCEVKGSDDKVEEGLDLERRNLKEEDEENVEILNLRRDGGDKENVEVFREEGGEEAASHGEVKNGVDCEVKESDGKAEEGFDLERMTLGEWFDYMEVNLQKQIIETTEEMIEGMRRKAEQVKDYMIEQKKKKGKVPVS